jgi:hypothetical protein
MNDKESIHRREGRIIGGGMLVGVAMGLAAPHILTNTFHVSPPGPIWPIILLSAGTGLINSGITKSNRGDLNQSDRRKAIFAIVMLVIFSGVLIWRSIAK